MTGRAPEAAAEADEADEEDEEVSEQLRPEDSAGGAALGPLTTCPRSKQFFQLACSRRAPDDPCSPWSSR